MPNSMDSTASQTDAKKGCSVASQCDLLTPEDLLQQDSSEQDDPDYIPSKYVFECYTKYSSMFFLEKYFVFMSQFIDTEGNFCDGSTCKM
jgi:hypothetical protein